MLRSLPRHHGPRLSSARSRSVRRPGTERIRAGAPGIAALPADYGWVAAPDGPADADWLDVGMPMVTGWAWPMRATATGWMWMAQVWAAGSYAPPCELGSASA